MNKKLNKLSKKELLEIIGGMKKKDLIDIIENKVGGGDEEILKITNTSIRKSIVYNKSKLNNSNNLAMANDNLYLDH